MTHGLRRQPLGQKDFQMVSSDLTMSTDLKLNSGCKVYICMYINVYTLPASPVHSLMTKLDIHVSRILHRSKFALHKRGILIFSDWVIGSSGDMASTIPPNDLLVSLP